MIDKKLRQFIIDKNAKPLPFERLREIQKQNLTCQSFAVRDLLNEVTRLQKLCECTEDNPCECCRINMELD